MGACGGHSGEDVQEPKMKPPQWCGGHACGRAHEETLSLVQTKTLSASPRPAAPHPSGS